MKISGWFLGGILVAGLGGLVFFGIGYWRPGRALWPESAPRTGLSPVAEAKQRLEKLGQVQKQADREVDGFSGLQGSEGEHRVLVSAQLVFLPENTEPVQPLDLKMKTPDGIAVGWKIKYGFDPADLGVADGDPDQDGFTNREEFDAGTDPTRKEESPAKENKLRARCGPPVSLTVSFPEKGGGLFTIRFEVPDQPKIKDGKPVTPAGVLVAEFKGKLGDVFWLLAGPAFVEVWSQESKMVAASARAQQEGRNSHATRLKLQTYQEKMETIKAKTAGGLELPQDNSFVLLERQDAVAGVQKLFISPITQPRSATWEVGEIRLYAPEGGGLELGPFRIGETFEYDGKKFAVLGREGEKIRLQNLSEPGKEPFWVPPEVKANPPASQP